MEDQPVRTFGRCEFREEGHEWVIAAEPHVLLRLKRLFGRVAAGATQINLSHTPEVCRDLEWFMLRYPLVVSHPDILKDGVERHLATARECEAIFQPGYAPRPFAMALPARHYQAQATALYMQRRFLLCADELGLGKSCVGIASFCDLRTRPACVVTMTHLTHQWENEIHKFLPTLRTHIVTRATEYPLPEFFGQGPDVVILNYAKLRGWGTALSKYCKSVIFDECQELRCTGTDKYESAVCLARAADFRLGLSATPIYNYGGEFHNVLSVLEEDALGKYDEFLREWCGGGWYVRDGKATVKDPAAFGSYVREHHFMIRRTRRDVGRELPEVNRIVHSVDSDPKALERIKGDAAALARMILRRVVATKEQRFTAAGQFDMLMRQATGIAKAPYVADFARMVVEGGEPVILYGWHREVYNLWAEALEDLEPVWFTGTESTKEKENSRKRFLSGESKLLFMSLRAGAGLDGLQQVCRTVIFGELDWSPGVHEQCIGRVHRDGQADPVAAYFLVSDAGSDPVVSEILGIKKAQVTGIRDPNAPLVERLSKTGQEIRALAEAYLRQVESPSKLKRVSATQKEAV